MKLVLCVGSSLTIFPPQMPLMMDTGLSRNDGRLAGAIYLLLALTAAFSLAYMPSQVFLKGDVQGTVRNLVAKESLFRWSILSEIISQVLFIFLVLQLARIFRLTDSRLTRHMVALVMVSVPIAILLELFHVGALMIAKGEWLPSLAVAERSEMSYMMLRLRGEGIGLVEVFWGLWLIPFGLLVIRSGMLPAIIGYLLIIGGLAYVIEFSTGLVNEGLHEMVQKVTAMLYALAELSTIVWLLVFGIKTKQSTHA